MTPAEALHRDVMEVLGPYVLQGGLTMQQTGDKYVCLKVSMAAFLPLPQAKLKEWRDPSVPNGAHIHMRLDQQPPDYTYALNEVMPYLQPDLAEKLTVARMRSALEGKV